ncbi:hypothetical protein BDW74DRAFT_148735 [Aspergillus multicolor]|uniref:uncharacterized protein n=1 Tax=Aspergillus multicolor TaxID=41759 RepID=UPI003CCDA0EA
MHNTHVHSNHSSRGLTGIIPPVASILGRFTHFFFLLFPRRRLMYTRSLGTDWVSVAAHAVW